MDPQTRTTTDLQAYWRQDDEGEDAEQWLSVVTSTQLRENDVA